MRRGCRINPSTGKHRQLHEVLRARPHTTHAHTHTHTLHDVRAIFDEFGEYTGLWLNPTKTKVLMQGVGPWPSQLAGMSVVPLVKYLGALFGDVTAAEAYEKGSTVFESRCVLISRMPLSRQEKVQPIHTWCYPILQVWAVAYYPPPPPHAGGSALACSVACGVWSHRHMACDTVTLNILHLPLTEGGYGLWMPDVYLLTAHA